MSSPIQVTTIFKDVIVSDFVIRAKDMKTQPATAPVICSEYYYMMLSSKSEKLNKFFLQMVDGKILMRSSPEGSLLGLINIDYARIKLLKPHDKCGKVLSGIRFIKDKNYEEILHPDTEIVQRWYDDLKRYCILSKFREIYTIKDMIGKGNFAKVYVSSRNADKKNFAAKIFDKKLILQDKFERVNRNSFRNVFFMSSK